MEKFHIQFLVLTLERKKQRKAFIEELPEREQFK